MERLAVVMRHSFGQWAVFIEMERNMEFVTVKYWRRRRVYINGHKSGYTNMTLRTNRGTQVVTLGDPPNYEPQRRRVTVHNTTAIEPFVVYFKKKGT